MFVYFVRHASAGTHKSDPVKDQKRALDEVGIEQCGNMGRALAAVDAHVDAILTSPLKRATQTAALVANEIAFEGKLEVSAALAPGATYAQFRDLLHKYAQQEAIMVVGHNPNLSEFLGRLLAGGGSRSGIDLKKGAVARVEVDRAQGVLNWCLTPKVVRALYSAAASKSRVKAKKT